MKKEFVPYEQALELKQLGFDEPCFGRYYYKESYPMLNPQSKQTELVFEFGQYLKQTKVTILAPTFSQAFRWFREKYNISHSIDWMTRSLKLYSGYYVHFRGINNTKINQDNYIVLNDELPLEGYRVYETYEEAELECLKKLIEIVKKK